MCTAIAAQTPAEMARKASTALSLGSDLVELRIDKLSRCKEDEIVAHLAGFGSRSVLTVRSNEEGGDFWGDEVARLALVGELAARIRPAMLDVELATAERHPGWFGSLPSHVRKIVSAHDFSGTPDLRTVAETLRLGRERGHFAKFVGTARVPEDNVTVLSACRARPRATVAFCMGELGTVSRVASMVLGSPLAYAALPGEAVAPGQLSVTVMLGLRRLLAL